MININGADRLRIGEALFQPSIAGITDKGIHDKVFDSVSKSDNEIRGMLWCNVVLAGGTSMMNGLPERLQKDLKLLAGSSTRVNIHAMPDRRNLSWTGG